MARYYNRKDINNSQNTVNSSLEYTPDDKTTFTLSYRGSFAPKSAGLYFVPNTIYNSQNIAESYYNTINDHNSRNINNNISFQAERKFDNSTLSLTTYYITSNYKSTRMCLLISILLISHLLHKISLVTTGRM